MLFSNNSQNKFKPLILFNLLPIQDDDLIATVEESAFVQRKYEKYFDMVIINEDFDDTFRQVVETLDEMSHQDQWVPVNWIY